MVNDIEIKRGQMYYIAGSSESIGSEQANIRPAIVVSNDKCNKFSPVIDVVFLTTQKKASLPTHVKIYSAPLPSIALCEHPTAVDKRRIKSYIGICSDDEIQRVNTALKIALGL